MSSFNYLQHYKSMRRFRKKTSSSSQTQTETQTQSDITQPILSTHLGVHQSNSLKRDSVLSFIYNDLRKTKNRLSNIIIQSKKKQKRYQKLQISNKHRQLLLSPPSLKFSHTSPNQHKPFRLSSKSQLSCNHLLAPLGDSLLISPSFRKKIMEVPYSKEWNKKAEIPTLNLNDVILKQKSFQFNILLDQIKLLLVSIQQYKSTYLGDKDLTKIIVSKGRAAVRRYNELMEETIVLMHQITKGMLMRFHENIDKFLSVTLPDVAHFCRRRVKDEEKEIEPNVLFFSQMNVFLKGSANVFEVIMKNADHFNLSKERFLAIRQFLERCRLNVSLLFYMTQNLYKDHSTDSKIVEEYLTGIKGSHQEEERVGEQTEIEKRRMNSHSNLRIVPKGSVLSLKELGYSEEQARLRKLKEMFEDKKVYEAKRHRKEKVKERIPNDFSLNSPLVSNILNYCSKEWRHLVISERVIQRFKQKEIENSND